jgi:hypothetical protein
MQKRAQKKRDTKQRQQQHRLREKQRLEGVLSALGLLPGFRDLPGWARDAAVRALPGRPRVVISAAAQGLPAMDNLKREVEEWLAGAGVLTAEGNAVPLLDFLSVCPTLPAGFKCLAPHKLSPGQRLFAERAAKVSAAFVGERLRPTVKEAGDTILMHLFEHSRMDGQLFGCTVDAPGLYAGRPASVLTLERTEPRVVHVEVDGKARPAFQCGVPRGLDGIRWLDCDGAALGLEAGRPYPVFLQSHALLRLRERLAGSLITEVALHMGLICSLAEPRVAERQGDTRLLEFHYRGIRAGYLPARVVDGKLVVTTFLLLTMQGSPEGRLLRRRLHLTGRDVEYARLDRLETFLAPDVLADKELVRVLEDSGCGPLLALARDGFPHAVEGGDAAELRRFLGMPADGTERLARAFSRR